MRRRDLPVPADTVPNPQSLRTRTFTSSSIHRLALAEVHSLRKKCRAARSGPVVRNLMGSVAMEEGQNL